MTIMKKTLLTTLALALILQGGGDRALAQASSSAVSNSGPSADQVFQQLQNKTDEFESLGWPPRGRVTLSPRLKQAYVDFNKRLWVNYNIGYIVAPTVMMQKSSQGGSEGFTANEQVLSSFAWRALNKTRLGTAYFFFSHLHLTQLTRNSGVNFSQALGINYFASDSVGNTDSFKAMLWRHELPGDVLTIIMGHGEIGGVDGGCRYACDDTQSFISSILSNNPTRTLPGQGTEIGADVKIVDGVVVEFSAADARGNGRLHLDRPFETNEWAYATALKIENPFKQFGDGLYKLTYYTVDETRKGTPQAQAASEGVTIQLDQDFGDLGLFVKYHQAFERKSLADKSAGGGVIWKAPFGNEEDQLGLGVGWIDPTAPNTNNEYVAETYYRMQLTPFVQVTADAMLTINPSKPGSSNEGVFSLRARGHF